MVTPFAAYSDDLDLLDSLCINIVFIQTEANAASSANASLGDGATNNTHSAIPGTIAGYDENPSHKPSIEAYEMFDHVQIKVEDLQRSRAFYQAVLGTLGYGVVLEFEGIVVGFGHDPHDMFEVRQADADADAPLTKAAHIAFTADSEEAVRTFHATALDRGAKDNGAPGLRPEYEDGYYAAFVIDPDGNNIEAVYSSR